MGLGRILGLLDCSDRFGGRRVAKKLPTWPQFGSQDGANIDEKSMNLGSPLGDPTFKQIFDLGGQHGGKLAPKSKPKSMLSSKGVFLKKHCFSFRKNILF